MNDLSYTRAYNWTFGGNMRAELLEKIIGNKNLLKVNLAGMKINDDEILEIMETIQQEKPTTTNIDLDNNNLSDKGAIILSKYLCDFKNLTELSVQFNNIGKEGAADLFSLKKVFSDLDILFHGNKITDADEMEEIERLALRGSPQSGQ